MSKGPYDLLKVTEDLLADAREKLARWYGSCDDVGVPHTPDALIQHHRGNAALAAVMDAFAGAETQYGVTDRHPDTDPLPLFATTEEEAWEAFDRFTSSGGLVLVRRRLTNWEEVTRNGD